MTGKIRKPLEFAFAMVRGCSPRSAQAPLAVLTPPAYAPALASQFSASFDGTTGKRTIRLGGRQDDREERKETLAKARREREQRKILRDQNKAATVLQSFTRSRCDVHRACLTERAAWDRKLHDVGRLRTILLAAKRQFSLPPDAVSKLLRQFLFFFRPAVDGARLASVCQLLLEVWPTFRALARVADRAAAWAQQMKLLVRCCLLAVAEWQHAPDGGAAAGGGAGSALEAVQQLLALLAARGALGDDARATAQGSELLLRALAPPPRRFGSGAEGGVLAWPEVLALPPAPRICDVLAAQLQQPARPGPDTLTSTLTQLVIRLLEPAAVSSAAGAAAIAQVYASLASSVLRLPLASRLPAARPLFQQILRIGAGTGAEKRASGWLHLLLAASREAGRLAGAALGAAGELPTTGAVVLGNLLELFALHSGSGVAADVAATAVSTAALDRSDAAAFVRSIAPLVELLPLSVFANASAQLDADAVAAEQDAQLEEEDEDEEQGGAGQQAESDVVMHDVLLRRLVRKRDLQAAQAISRADSGPNALPALVKVQLQRLIDPRLIAALFGLLLQSPAADAMDTSEDVSSAIAGALGADVGADPVLLLCGMYRSILCRWGDPILTKGHMAQHGAALAVLNGIAYADATLVRALWAHLSSGLGARCFTDDASAVGPPAAQASAAAGGGGASAAGAAAARTAAAPAVEEGLHLFFAACVHLFHAIDDEEVFDKQRPFTRAELLQLVVFLKNLLYQQLWIVDSSAALSGLTEEQQLNSRLYVSVATRLFNQLFERGTRRGLCPAEQWHWRQAVNLFSGSEARGGPALANAKAWRVLVSVPQVLPFDRRVVVLQQLLEQDHARFHDEWEHVALNPERRFTVRRDQIFADSLDAFRRLSAGDMLKTRLQVNFVNEQGLHEAGIDGGGLWKEFMDTLTKHAFDTEYALFAVTPDGLLHPSPGSQLASEDHLAHFEFLGQVIGKAVYDGTLVEPQFADFFLNKLLGRLNSVDDLVHLDPEFYRHLMQLKHFDAATLDSCELSFEVSDSVFGGTESRELCRGGSAIRVTPENRLRYIHLTAHYRLNTQTARQCFAFLRGFRKLVPVRWIRMFSASELRLLICGTQNMIDLVDLRRHTNYSGGYHDTQEYISWFWEAVETFDADQRAALLRFATSCSRQPLLGFRQMQPAFCIQQVRIADDVDRLPSSSTCMNLLKLPTYSSKEVLREKLLYAVLSGAGFELS